MGLMVIAVVVMTFGNKACALSVAQKSYSVVFRDVHAAFREAEFSMAANLAPEVGVPDKLRAVKRVCFDGR